MSEEHVGFGAPKPPVDKEIEEAKKVLEAALEEPDVLNDFEKDFCSSSLEQIKQYGSRWKYSLNRQEMVEKIRAKLEKEGLI